MTRVVILPAAVEDLDEQAAYFPEEAVADHWYRQTEKTFADLARFPAIGAEIVTHNPRLRGIRTLTVVGFKNHVVYYRVVGNRVEIVRVLHGARDVENLF